MQILQKARGRSLKLLLKASAIIFITTFVVRLAVYTLGASYDWDIDHHMYYGSRLLRGELVYTFETYDHLPFEQFLFAIPAALGSVSYWVMLSGLFAITASAFMFIVVKQIIRDDWPSPSRRIATDVALFSSTFYLFLISVMPGSITVTSSMAASMTLIAVCLQLIYCRYSNINKLNKILTYTISALLAVLSISMRPYLAPPIVLLGLWIPLRRRAVAISNNSITDSSTTMLSGLGSNTVLVFRYALIWTTSLIFLGSAINITPYVFTGNLDHFAKGILLGSQRLNTQTIQTNILSQATSLLEMGNAAFILSSIALLVPIGVALNRALLLRSIASVDISTRLMELDLIFSGLIPVFLIEFAILGRHFWPHYQQMSAPFIALSLAFSIAYLYKNKFVKVSFNGPPLAILLSIIIFLTLFMRVEIIKSVRNIKPHPHALYSEVVKKLVDKRKQNDLPADFLHLNSMYLHWKLGESRHGFPSAANMEHINWGWWASLDKNNTNNLYTTPEELCQALQEKGPTIVIMDRKFSSYPCFTSSESLYYDAGYSFPEIPSTDTVFIRK